MNNIKYFDKVELPKRAIYSVYSGTGLFAPEGESLEEVITKVRKMRALQGSTDPIIINIAPIEDEPTELFKLDPTDATPWRPHELKTILSHHGAHGDYLVYQRYNGGKYTISMYHRNLTLDYTATRIINEFFFVDFLADDNTTWHIDAMFSYDMLYDPNYHPSKLKFGFPLGGSKYCNSVTSKYAYYDSDDNLVVTDYDNIAVLLPIRIDSPRGSKWINYRYAAEIIYPFPDMNYHVYDPELSTGVGNVVPVDSIDYDAPTRPVIPGIDRYYVKPLIRLDEDITLPDDPVYIDASDIDVIKKNVADLIYEKYGISDTDIEMEIYKVPEGMWFISEYNQEYMA